MLAYHLLYGYQPAMHWATQWAVEEKWRIDLTAQTKETDSRILIDDQLRAAGWNPADKSHVLTEVLVTGGALKVAEPNTQATVLTSDDRDVVPTGRADYVLLDQRGRPLAIIEAKRQAIHPYVAKQQALPYAKQIGAPFIFLTNGPRTSARPRDARSGIWMGMNLSTCALWVSAQIRWVTVTRRWMMPCDRPCRTAICLRSTVRKRLTLQTS